MKILILGSGGREHALAWAFGQNPKCDALYVAPGNAGIKMIAECVADLNILSGAAIANFCEECGISFVVIGPEAPLVAGVVDELRARGVTCFGPTKAAACLEASKSFTKELCAKRGIPTAAFAHLHDLASAKTYIREHALPIVLKADGLAAGKGVIIAENYERAEAALAEIFSGSFGEAAGCSVVIEEFMEGEEASLFVLCDGKDILPIGTAQDHKRAYDGDEGPNTGGMGAYSPAHIMTEKVIRRSLSEIIQPTIDEMAARGTPFTGVLYAGLMIKDENPRLVEYNVRFGDPECQVIAMRLGGQFLDACEACAEGRLSSHRIHWADDHALSVVMAAKGYPADYQKGSIISGIDDFSGSSHEMIFHAGTARKDGALIANGGRVLNVTARAASLTSAKDKAYALIKEIDWEDGFYRKDIGWRAESAARRNQV